MKWRRAREGKGEGGTEQGKKEAKKISQKGKGAKKKIKEDKTLKKTRMQKIGHLNR